MLSCILLEKLKNINHQANHMPFPPLRTMSHLLCISLFYLLFFISATYSFQLNDDLLALIVFKSDLIDPKNALKSWNEDDNSPCNWEGIVCNAENGRVITLNLTGLSLSWHIGRTLAKLEIYRDYLSIK